MAAAPAAIDAITRSSTEDHGLPPDRSERRHQNSAAGISTDGYKQVCDYSQRARDRTRRPSSGYGRDYDGGREEI